MITLAVGAALAFVLWRIGDELRRERREAAVRQLFATFAAAAAQQDPKQLVPGIRWRRPAGSSFPTRSRISTRLQAERFRSRASS